MRIGRIVFDRASVPLYTSSNSSVFLGSFAGKPAVVKVTRSAAGCVTNKGVDDDGGSKEESILLELAHVNVVNVFGSEVLRDEMGTSHFLATEPCIETREDGTVVSRTLEHVVVAGNPDLATRLELIRQIARGLRYLHGNEDLASFGLTHRDVKPANILVKRLRSGVNVAKLAGKSEGWLVNNPLLCV
jgi:serine/threonine protein kinase